MVDLHPQAPGLPAGHRWLELSRWGILWRVTLATALIGMLGSMLLGLIDLGNMSGRSPFHGPIGTTFGLLPAPVFGLLAAAVAPRLRRFFPFTQGVLFGLLGVVVCAAVALLYFLLETAVLGCGPGTECFHPSSSFILVMAVAGIAGLPLAIMAGGGLGLAILVSNNRVAARAFPLLLLGTALVFASLQMVFHTAEAARSPELEHAEASDHSGNPLLPEGMCAGYDAHGDAAAVPCGRPDGRAPAGPPDSAG